MQKKYDDLNLMAEAQVLVSAEIMNYESEKQTSLISN